MMDRRRALMGVDRSLLFSVVNRSITTTGERIETGLKVLKPGQKYTILIDLTNTSNPTSNNSRQWKPIVAWNNTANTDGIALGKGTDTASLQKISWNKTLNTQGTNIPNSNPSPGRHRYCLLRETDSYITLKYKKNNNNVETVTASGSLTEATGGWLNFGDTGKNGLPPGTFTAFVYNRILTQKEIDAFFE